MPRPSFTSPTPVEMHKESARLFLISVLLTVIFTGLDLYAVIKQLNKESRECQDIPDLSLPGPAQWCHAGAGTQVGWAEGPGLESV